MSLLPTSLVLDISDAAGAAGTTVVEAGGVAALPTGDDLEMPEPLPSVLLPLLLNGEAGVAVSRLPKSVSDRSMISPENAILKNAWVVKVVM
ncbi:hypothetical protein IMCC9480_2948 [Oxalobacteraceae bacterium IMCC9480]|nr:hypothetical protein IMCC9480_2948 [Oxalobacteraceae bacterium IMCC9480]